MSDEIQQGRGQASPSLACSPFVVGDRVDCSEWDATVPPQNRIGPATVVRVWRAKCQGGIMVKVRGRGTLELAAPWLTHLSENADVMARVEQPTNTESENV